jgi:hypothetical protein
VNREEIVPVDDAPFDAVAQRFVGDVLARVLFGGRRRQAVLVVLDDEQDRKLPDRGEVDRFVEVAFAGRAVSGERRRDALFAAKLRGQRQAVRDREHRAQMRDHADDAMLERSEVKGAVAPLGEAPLLSEELTEQLARSTPRVVKTPRFRCIGRMKSSGSAPRPRRRRSPPGRSRKTTSRASPGEAG